MPLSAYLDEFTDLDAQERLETLIDFGDLLPPLPPELADLPGRPDCRVQECQTPVYLSVRVAEGRVHLAASVTEKSPTVRGYVGMLVAGLQGATPTEIAAVPDDIVKRLGLEQALGMTRTRGFTGVLQRIKRAVREAN